MNPGDSVQDASRPGLDEASGLGAAAGQGSASNGSGTSTRSPRTQKPLQDIQDIIDQLAVVTQELRRPKSSVAGPSN